MRTSRLWSFLGEPGTGSELSLEVTRHAGGEPYDGLVRRANGAIVGILRSFRFDFVNLDADFIAECLQTENPPVAVENARRPTFKDPHDPAFTYSDDWFSIAPYLHGTNGQGPNSSARFIAGSDRVDIRLHKHPWSGHCRLMVNGVEISRHDLFHPSTAIPYAVPIHCRSGDVISIEPLACRHEDALGTQVIIEGAIEYSHDHVPVSYQKFAPRNRGGQFHARFDEIRAKLDNSAIILDIGGGRRQIDDDRYLNLEYSLYEEPDMFGDATRLPFRDNSVDFVYSAAVMEHVRDPLAMGREITRVLKPGGTALVNAAFMQPIHSEGQHFFNVTPYGLEESLRGLDRVRSWWEGDLSTMLGWFLRVSGIERKANPAALTAFLDQARQFDQLLDSHGLMYIASGVWFEGTKPSRDTVANARPD